MKKIMISVLLMVGVIVFVGCGNSSSEASEAVDKVIEFNNETVDSAIKSIDESIEEAKNYDIDKDVEEARTKLEEKKRFLNKYGYEKEKEAIDNMKNVYQNQKLPQKIEELENSKQSSKDERFEREKSSILVYEDDNNYYVYLRRNVDDDVHGKLVYGDGFKVGKENGRITTEASDRKKIVGFFRENEKPVFEEKNIDLYNDEMRMR